QLGVAAGSASASVNLTNTPGAPALVTVTAGDNQSTTVGTDFGTQLAMTVTDQFGNAVPGAAVTFTVPAAGASASLVEAGPYTADSAGNLVVPAHANGTAGSYSLTAASDSVSATFQLTNLPAGTALLTAGGSSCASIANSSAPALGQVGYAVNKGKLNS